MNVVVVGAQWGDEGKGKVVDFLSAQAQYIVRYQGGNNAGHTLVVGGKKTVLHLIPSGVLQAGKTCLIANGVVFDPAVFFEEVESLQAAGVLGANPSERIRVSERAHVILPYHCILDRLREEKSAAGKIGTTVRGIGPAYEDKAARRGVQVVDLLHPKLLRSKLENALAEKNILFRNYFSAPEVPLEKIYEDCLKLGERLRPYISDVRETLFKAIKAGTPVLFEGAQGTLLDLDHGTYPFVTSSSTIAGGALTGSGVGQVPNLEVIGIAKAYTTRVGTGPFPTEIEVTQPEIAANIRKIGAEFGATTGRPRRIGWLDLVALRYAAQVNGLTGLALMKTDVLDGFESLQVCTHYLIDGKRIETFPSCVEDLERLVPGYITVPGWSTANQNPKTLSQYVELIEKYLEIPVILISTGPGREETQVLRNPFEKKRN